MLLKNKRAVPTTLQHVYSGGVALEPLEERITAACAVHGEVLDIECENTKGSFETGQGTVTVHFASAVAAAHCIAGINSGKTVICENMPEPAPLTVSAQMKASRKCSLVANSAAIAAFKCVSKAEHAATNMQAVLQHGSKGLIIRNAFDLEMAGV